jgi:hypothetical protein
MGNRCFEDLSQVTYLGTMITNENLIQEEIKRRFNLRNASYHSVHNVLSSRLLSKNIKIRIYKTIFSLVALTIREEHSLRVFENPSLSAIRVIKSRRMRWAGNVVQIGEKRNAYRIWVGKPEGKRPLGRPTRRRLC